MTRYLLDTNILSGLLRDPHGPIARRIAEVGEIAICTSIIVAAELRFGAAKKQSERLTSRVEHLLSLFDIEPFDTPADAVYAQVRAELEASGGAIGAIDTIIAAHALALDCVMVTDNEKEFSRTPGLKVENWLR